jgi:hypothetical protein
MSNHASAHQTRREDVTADAVDAAPIGPEVAAHADPRDSGRLGRHPSSSPTAPPFASRQRLTTAYIQGDFATGQRTRRLQAAPVGTYASQ